MDSMPTPAVSVLVPAYNVERYLGDCLDSVLSQEGAEFEIVCVDDGSTDGTGRILERYEAADARIRVIRQENAGPAAARNRLLDEARGKWICSCDADDLLAPGALRRMLSSAQAGGLDALFFCAEAFYDSAELEDRYPSFKTYYAVSRDFSVPRPGAEYFCDCVEAGEWKPAVWLAFFRRDLARRSGIRCKDGLLHEDVPFTVALALDAERAARIPDRLYRRRVRGNSIMTVTDPVPHFLGYLHGALAIAGYGETAGVSPRTQAALGATAAKYFRLARKFWTAATEEDRSRLAAERPCKAVLADILSKTRTEEEYRQKCALIARRDERIADLKESVSRREKRIASLEKALAAQRRENGRLRSSRSYRLGKALLAVPRFLLGRGTAARENP